MQTCCAVQFWHMPTLLLDPFLAHNRTHQQLVCMIMHSSKLISLLYDSKASHRAGLCRLVPWLAGWLAIAKAISVCCRTVFLQAPAFRGRTGQVEPWNVEDSAFRIRV